MLLHTFFLSPSRSTKIRHTKIVSVERQINMPNEISDDQTRVSDLRDLVAQFVNERDWSQFHSPKNLSMSIAIEAAELMEHFQWLTVEQSKELSPEQRVEVSEELADVLCYTVALANSLDLDISQSVFRKMELNREKYPAEKFQGKFGLADPEFKAEENESHDHEGTMS